MSALALVLALSPITGHAAELDPAGAGFLLYGTHAVAAGTWFGGLSVLTWFSLSSGRDAEPANQGTVALRRFSSIALPAMLAAIASGMVAAWTETAAWPALFGTLCGQTLLVKTSVFLSATLLLAQGVRVAVTKSGLGFTAPVSRLRLEWGCGIGVAICAALLSTLVPAKHDAVSWPLPFRLAPRVAWKGTESFGYFCLSLAVLALFALVLSALRRRRSGRWLQLSTLAICVGSAGSAAYHGSVAAYPSTYARPEIAYDAQSVAAGHQRFLKDCAACHGAAGHGDGPVLTAVPMSEKINADLTGPHTSDHTVGDMFWWIAHGKPPTIMPAFQQQLSSSEIWSLINYLRALSAGYQSRLLTSSVIALQPWLASINFTYQDDNGAIHLLSDQRERSAVQLVLRSRENQLAALGTLLEAAPASAACAEHLSLWCDRNWRRLPHRSLPRRPRRRSD